MEKYMSGKINAGTLKIIKAFVFPELFEEDH